MTWNTPQGNRTLQGAEAVLFAICIPTMIDLYNDDDSKPKKLNYGCQLVQGAFEKLTTPQQFTVLEDVSTALLTDTPTCPTLNAVNESAVYYVYKWLEEQFDDVEIGVEVWGQHIIDAYNQVHPSETKIADDDSNDESDSRPTLDNFDEDVWITAIEALADQILWDRDFEMEDTFSGTNPFSSLVMDRMGIEQGYFLKQKIRARPGAVDRLYDFCSKLAYPKEEADRENASPILSYSPVLSSEHAVDHETSTPKKEEQCPSHPRKKQKVAQDEK